ncbi:MAG: flavin reductase family protein [Chloroflexota bacterium]
MTTLQPVSQDEFRSAMRHWASSVAIVTVNHKGEQHGMTVSSFTSIAAEPPLIIVSLQTSSRTHNLVAQAGTFGVTVLAEDQQAISERFAGRVADDDDRFVGLATETLVTGTPFLTGSLACLDCRVVGSYSAGTNTVFFGEVLATRTHNAGNPLLYFNRAYRRMAARGPDDDTRG